MILNEFDSEKIIKKYLPTIKSIFIKTDKITNKKIEFPAFIKGTSKELTHKKRFGFVELVNNKKELEKAIKKMTLISKKKSIKLDGYVIQKKIIGTEFILGLKKDKTFGYVIMFGIGGSNTEKINDIVFRSCPIKRKDAQEMLNEIKNQALLIDINKDKIISTLLNLCKITKKYNIKELDINPVIVNKNSLIAVDALLILE